MPNVCLYFQIHQPRRLKRYSFFDIGRNHDYEDEDENRRILNRVAEKCYLPAGELLLSLIAEYGEAFRIAFSLSGAVMDQLEHFRPDVLALFQRLARTGSVEFLNETDAHSLSFLYSPVEFREQVLKHRERTHRLFGQAGRTFRNTELIYNNALAALVEKMGYEAILAEGTEKILDQRSPNLVYQPAGCQAIRLLLRNYRLSDDVAFRFSDRNWKEHPLTADKYAGWISRIGGKDAVVNIFMDFETFGEHQWAETGIFDFLKAFPGELLRNTDSRFQTPAEAAASHQPAGLIDCPNLISWADEERDATAWLGNPMQQDAAKTIYLLETALRTRGDKSLLQQWRMLQTSDHFYYMCTKWSADGDVHRYFNPYESPYAAYINYMNIVEDLSRQTAK
jgi:alpha-amylase